eukprot:SAG11_NODE_465_length_9217_cov_93.852161_2_plen_201_part_00
MAAVVAIAAIALSSLAGATTTHDDPPLPTATNPLTPPQPSRRLLLSKLQELPTAELGRLLQLHVQTLPAHERRELRELLAPPDAAALPSCAAPEFWPTASRLAQKGHSLVPLLRQLLLGGCAGANGVGTRDTAALADKAFDLACDALLEGVVEELPQCQLSADGDEAIEFGFQLLRAFAKPRASPDHPGPASMLLTASSD